MPHYTYSQSPSRWFLRGDSAELLILCTLFMHRRMACYMFRKDAHRMPVCKIAYNRALKGTRRKPTVYIHSVNDFEADFLSTLLPTPRVSMSENAKMLSCVWFEICNYGILNRGRLRIYWTSYPAAGRTYLGRRNSPECVNALLVASAALQATMLCFFSNKRLTPPTTSQLIVLSPNC